MAGLSLCRLLQSIDLRKFCKFAESGPENPLYNFNHIMSTKSVENVLIIYLGRD